MNSKLLAPFLLLFKVSFGNGFSETFSRSSVSRNLSFRSSKMIAVVGEDTDDQDSRGRSDVRKLMDLVVAEYPSEPAENWSRTRGYFYRKAQSLSITQVRQVLEFIQGRFDHQTQVLIFKEIPRIFQKSVSTFLEPTVDFLWSLYGEDLLKEAVTRNPKLLLASGIGYDSDVLDMASICLKDELDLSDSAVAQLKRRSPFLFTLSASKLLSTISFLKSIWDDSGTCSPSEVRKIVGKIVASHPEILRLSVEDNLEPSLNFLSDRCGLDKKKDVGSVIKRSNGAILGLSVETNLGPTITFLEERLDTSELRKCILSHPQILGLSLENLREKAAYFDSIQQGDTDRTTSLVARILVRCPEVISLSLIDNIKPKVNFLANVWGFTVNMTSPPPGGNTSGQGRNTLASLLSETPGVLSLSLDGNIMPTVTFFNRTGYIQLDENWRRISDKPGHAKRPLLRGRCIAASLFNRLFPRYHFCRSMDPDMTPPLHILVSATDSAFCEYLGADVLVFNDFKTETVPRLRFSSQFDTWLKTGRPIDVSYP